MPRTDEQYEEMRRVTREKIHSAAIKLFAKKGLVATSVKDIANDAEISIGLMYRHYRTKEDLFKALVSYASDGLQVIVDRFQKDVSPMELIQQFTNEMLDDLKKGEEFANFLMLMNQAATMEESTPEIDLLNKRSEALLTKTAQIIEKGQKLGQFKKGNPNELVIYYFSTIQGLAMTKLTMNERYVSPSDQIVLSFLIDGECTKFEV